MVLGRDGGVPGTESLVECRVLSFRRLHRYVASVDISGQPVFVETSVAIPPRAALGMPRGRVAVSGDVDSGRGGDGPEHSGDHGGHRDATAGERVPRRVVTRDVRRRPARGVQPRGDRVRDPPRRAGEEDSDHGSEERCAGHKSDSEAEVLFAPDDAVDEAEELSVPDSDMDEAEELFATDDDAEELFAPDDDADAAEELFAPYSESDSDGFLVPHDPFYETLPTSFAMAGEALRDCLLDMLAEGPLFMAALVSDAQMANQMSRVMPRHIPLEVWIERRIGAEVETVTEGNQLICQLVPPEEHVGAPKRDVRKEPPKAKAKVGKALEEPPKAKAKVGRALQDVSAPKAKAKVGKASDEVPKAKAKVGKASEEAPKAKAKVGKAVGRTPKAKAKVDVGQALKPVPKTKAKADKVSDPVPEDTEPKTLSGLRSQRDRSRTPRGETRTPREARRQRELRYPGSVIGVVSRPPAPRPPTPELEDPPGEWRETQYDDRWPASPPFHWEKRSRRGGRGGKRDGATGARETNAGRTRDIHVPDGVSHKLKSINMKLKKKDVARFRSHALPNSPWMSKAVSKVLTRKIPEILDGVVTGRVASSRRTRSTATTIKEVSSRRRNSTSFVGTLVRRTIRRTLRKTLGRRASERRTSADLLTLLRSRLINVDLLTLLRSNVINADVPVNVKVLIE